MILFWLTELFSKIHIKRIVFIREGMLWVLDNSLLEKQLSNTEVYKHKFELKSLV